MSSMISEAANVHSMRDFLAATLAQTEQLDRELHAMRDKLRARLHALDLAQDDTFSKGVEATADRFARGEDHSVSLEDLRSSLTSR